MRGSNRRYRATYIMSVVSIVVSLAAVAVTYSAMENLDRAYEHLTTRR